EGHVLRTAAEAEGVLTPEALGAAGDDLVDVLVALHGVDIDRVGLGDLGRREGYIERQLRRWYGQFLQSQEQAREAGVFRPSPLVGQAHRLLSERVPAQQAATIVHGDYRLDNTIVGPDGRLRAVLDWELCTLGDPLADIGTMLMYSSGRNATGASRPATTLPGFPALTTLADRYAARSGRDLTRLAYYAAFANWRLSCISEGVFTRYATGAMGSDRSEATVMAESAERRAHLAMELLEGNDLGAAIG
ncbi:MAG: phosphotransferase family protein, partial [Acidimicrobiales bacterium]